MTDQQDPVKIVDAFDKYISPRKNIIYDRYLFYSRNQAEGENFDNFLTDIKKLLVSCEFKEEKDDMLTFNVLLCGCLLSSQLKKSNSSRQIRFQI